MAYLALIRHGQSEWNALGKWTGWTDVPLSGEGHIQAKNAATSLSDIHFDFGFTSGLIRAQQTLDDILSTIDQASIPVIKNLALNERNYGDLTGKNKWKIKEEFGEEQFMKWRRSWNEPITNGESLKDVYARVIPYYESEILPKLKDGKNVLIAAHGNSLRALAKYLESISDEEIAKTEIGLGEVYLYTIDSTGKMVNKETRAVNTNKLTQ